MIICTFQVLANLIVLIAFGGDAKLRRNPNLILLASLAFIDFAYALLSIPYLIILITFWVPEGEEFNYNAVMVIYSGAMPAALMKSGCTITTLIALDRVIALYFIGGFIVSLLMALFDLTILFRFTHIHAVPGCTSFDCFTSTKFRAYWGLSNMVVNTISCILTIALVIGLKRLRANRQEHLSRVRQAARDKSADRVAMYILIVSAVFGVIPGTINGCAEFTHIVVCVSIL
ncbi:unnamed protein product [Anisakis simplex]|uniref:G-protein coupled receptors family 1 profile domain-containing protein n=1 Tax=Anisakis simplex TaxID=6269 RepID=A0A3P6N996_ANISI|nr:unnamed protein product [Anisakis simplex]